MTINKDHEQHFIRWATINHGDHETNPNKDNCCSVACMLLDYQHKRASLASVLNSIIDTEGFDWEESWELYMKDNNLTNETS